MIISDIELYSIEIPSQIAPEIRSVLVRLISHAGQEGWGEATISWRQNELEARRNHLLTILAGRNVFDLEELIHLESLQPSAIRFAIEMACWDMIGRICKHPTCHFHGGEYRHRIPVVAKIFGESPEETTKLALELANQGYHWQVFSLSGDIEEDMRWTELILATLNNRVELRIDAGQHYSYEKCLSLLAKWENTNIAMLIDPLDKNHCFREVATLQEHTEIPLALRRGIHSAHDVFEIARYGNIRKLALEPQRLGSTLAVKKSAAVAEAAGIRVSLTSEGSIGPLFASMLQLSASLPALSLGNECYPHHLGVMLLMEPMEISDGLIILPHTPGLSIEIDRPKLEQFQAR